MSASPINEVSAAVFTALNVAELLTQVSGVFGAVPELAPYPYVVFEISQLRQAGGFGTQPGRGDVPDLEIRLHAITAQPNVSEGQRILDTAIHLLYDTPLAVNGYRVCGSGPLSDIQILNLGDQLVANVTVHEEVAICRLMVEQGAA